jgi:hypothetical protein
MIYYLAYNIVTAITGYVWAFGDPFTDSVTNLLVVLGGLVVIVLSLGLKVRGFRPGRGRWIFKGDKYLQHDFLWRESKVVSPLL